MLTDAWSPQLFGRYESKETDLSVDKITAAIRSKWFWAFLTMTDVICSALVAMGHWSENCPCHSNFWKLSAKSRVGQRLEQERKFNKLIRQKVVRDEFGKLVDLWSNCPGKGKRAVELACGAFQTFVEKLFVEGMAPVLLSCQGLSEAEHQGIVRAFSEGKIFMLTALTLKLKYWTVLPWKLCGLLHWDHALAMECALQCLALYKQRPIDSEHHRIAVEFLSPAGQWLNEVVQLSQGVRLFSLSVAFVSRCLQLGLVPVAERIMESRHALVQNRLRLGKKGGGCRAQCHWVQAGCGNWNAEWIAAQNLLKLFLRTQPRCGIRGRLCIRLGSPVTLGSHHFVISCGVRRLGNADLSRIIRSCGRVCGTSCTGSLVKTNTGPRPR